MREICGRLNFACRSDDEHHIAFSCEVERFCVGIFGNTFAKEYKSRLQFSATVATRNFVCELERSGWVFLSALEADEMSFSTVEFNHVLASCRLMQRVDVLCDDSFYHAILFPFRKRCVCLVWLGFLEKLVEDLVYHWPCLFGAMYVGVDFQHRLVVLFVNAVLASTEGRDSAFLRYACTGEHAQTFCIGDEFCRFFNIVHS